MKTIEIKIDVYSFNELSDNAKEKAKNGFQYDDFWHNERMQSYRTAKEIYNLFSDIDMCGFRLYKWVANNVLYRFVATKKYCIDNVTKRKNSYYQQNRKIYGNEKVRFSNINNEIDFCLTGYCDDYSFFEPLIDFCKYPDKHTSSNDLFNTDLDSIFERISENEYNNFYTDDVFCEMCDANEYTFDVNGKMINL